MYLWKQTNDVQLTFQVQNMQLLNYKYIVFPYQIWLKNPLQTP